jgi:hypothetical protein
MKTISQDIQCAGWVLNQEPPKHESRALLLEAV